MPAVDPSRLERQIDLVLQVFPDPERLRYRCLDLLEFYASRVRTAAPDGHTGGVRSLGVPASVIRALQQALVRKAAAEPHPGAMAAEALWATPVMEARWLAIALLETRPAADLPSWVEAWSETAEDPQLLERLATGPVGVIRRSDPEGFWRAVASDLAGEGEARTVAALALCDAVPSLADADLPRLFRVMAEAPIPEAGEAWRAYLGLIRAAARRTPSETARHLADEIERARPGATRLARQTMADFPPRERDALRRALRLGEPPAASRRPATRS
jgi:hypothetical protein